MHHQVGPVGEGPIQRGRGECGVDDEQRSAVVRDGGDRGDVGDLGGRVRDGLDMHQTSGRAHGLFDRVRIGCVDEGRLDAVFDGEQFGEQFPRGLVGDVGDHHMVTGVEIREEDRVQRGNPRGQGDCVFRLFERRQLLLQRNLIGARVAGVQRDVGSGPADVRRVVGQGVRVRHHDRRAYGAGALVHRVARVHRAAVEGQGGRVVVVGAAHQLRLRRGHRCHAGTDVAAMALRRLRSVIVCTFMRVPDARLT